MEDRRRWDRRQLEHRLTHPQMIPPLGAFFTQARALRDEWVAELGVIDEHIADEVARRRELVEKIRLANRSLVGTGQDLDASGRMHQYRWQLPALPFDDPILVAPAAPGPPAPPAPPGADDVPSSAAPADAPVLAGRELREAVNAILRTTRAALTATEIARLLGAHGYAVATPTRTIPNALRPDIRSGRVERLGRGVYRSRRTDAAA